jgi:hypothetical protein
MRLEHTILDTHTHAIGLLWTSDQLFREATAYTTKISGEYIMPSARFEPAIPAIEQLQTHAWDFMATGIGSFALRCKIGTCILSEVHQTL